MANPRNHPLNPDDPKFERDRQIVRNLEMMQRYKNVFGSEEGRLVLGDVLTFCHFGETLDPNDPVRVAEYNVGLTILRMAGGLDLIYSELGMGR